MCVFDGRPAVQSVNSVSALFGQDHVTWLASLSLPDCQRIAVGVEIRAPQIGKLGISATCQERRLHHAPEILWACID